MALINVTCNRCGEKFQMDIGHMTLDEIKATLAKRDSFNCPGHHFEIGSPLDYWTFGEFCNGSAPTEAEWYDTVREKYGKLYTSDELGEMFEVTGFSSGMCVTRVKGSNGETAIFDFKSSPNGTRYYYRTGV
jgi:hypothetical protein